jgi:hypothetical protein
MTRDDIIRMAREAGFDPHDMSDDFTCNLEDIERFAALVAAKEREACAKLCEELLPGNGSRTAAAIRARGEQ